MPEPIHCSATLNKIGSEVAFKENVEGIEEWPHKLEFREHSYRLNNYTGDTLPKWQERAVTVAFRMIQFRARKISFRRERNRDVTVDFDISFEPGDHFSSPYVLAHDYYPGQGAISSDCHINDDWDWVPTAHMGDLNHPPLIPVLGHEFLHGCGFVHDTASSSMGKELMYPSFDLGKIINKLGPRDIQRIGEQYGLRDMPHWIIQYFITRRNEGWDFF
jgi:hypothetical protein